MLGNGRQWPKPVSGMWGGKDLLIYCFPSYNETNSFPHMELYAFNFVYLQWQSEEEHTETQKHEAILLYLPQQQGGNQILNWGLMHQYSNFTNHWKAKPVIYMLSIEFTHSADTEWYDYPTGWYTCHSSCVC